MTTYRVNIYASWADFTLSREPTAYMDVHAATEKDALRAVKRFIAANTKFEVEKPKKVKHERKS